MDRVLNTNDDLKLKFDQQYTNEMHDLKADLAILSMCDLHECCTYHTEISQDSPQ